MADPSTVISSHPANTGISMSTTARNRMATLNPRKRTRADDDEDDRDLKKTILECHEVVLNRLTQLEGMLGNVIGPLNTRITALEEQVKILKINKSVTPMTIQNLSPGVCASAAGASTSTSCAPIVNTADEAERKRKHQEKLKLLKANMKR